MIVNQLKEQYGKFIFMAARFDIDKDQESVIKAFQILKEQYHITHKLVFGGDGSILNKCKDLVHHFKLDEEIFFPGNLTNVQDYYAASNIYIQSSPAEGLLTVLLEAMKYHTPIVATRSMPGVEEVLCGNKYGLQCEVSNPKDIAEKLYKMIEDESLQEHYIHMGNERIKDFSYDLIKQKLTKLLIRLD